MSVITQHLHCKIKHRLFDESMEWDCTSPPSSRTNTSPCSKGDIVPASVFKYGSTKQGDEQSLRQVRDEQSSTHGEHVDFLKSHEKRTC
jgi:hypothetical protein